MLCTQSGMQIFSQPHIKPITGGLENIQFMATPSLSESPKSLCNVDYIAIEYSHGSGWIIIGAMNKEPT